jgi:CubicO group peptidase (beta-lactamase class C family)
MTFPAFVPLRVAAGALAIVVAGRSPAAARDDAQGAAAGRLSAVQAARIEAILEGQRQEQHIPGLAFVVVAQDRIVYLRTLGLRDLEHHLPVTEDTVFPIGSCTKAFTSMAIAVSQDRGLLSLDDPPRRYLPYFRMKDPEADAQVNLRDMLCHRTGLRAYADLAAEPGVLTREEYVRAATSAKPSAKFRAAFQYSNAMYSAAGEVLGAAHHSTWERVVERMIFGPLRMDSSRTAARDAARSANHATGYVYDETAGTWRAVPPPQSLGALAPGGNIASTARDMARWLRMLTGGGRIGRRQFVSTEALRALTTPQIAINASTSYALGWATYDRAGRRVVEHNGGSQGLSALVSFIPDRQIGFLFLANTSPNFMTRIGNAGRLLWPVLLGEDALAAQGTTTPPTPSSPSPFPSPSALATPTLLTGAPPPPALDDLLGRMVRALGGEEALGRHHSLEIRAVKAYENQGVTADLIVRAKAPNRRVEEEVWTAAGKRIARLRIYFDGTQGGQETTFGQDATNDAVANDRARRDASLHPLLALKDLYPHVRVRAVEGEGPDAFYVLELVPATGPPVLLHVSARTALVVKRETPGESVVFEDYRPVDGEWVAFRSTIQDALGVTSIAVEDVRFNTEIPDAAFLSKSGGALTHGQAGVRDPP